MKALVFVSYEVDGSRYRYEIRPDDGSWDWSNVEHYGEAVCIDHIELPDGYKVEEARYKWSVWDERDCYRWLHAIKGGYSLVCANGSGRAIHVGIDEEEEAR